jgi:polysaccharide export outer membrane protein
MKHRSLAPLLLLFALSASAPALHAQAPRAPLDTSVVLRPGDLVKVVVWRNAEMSGDFVVGINGALRHPLYQEVPVAGVPLQTVEARLKEYLSKYSDDPQLIVEPLFRVTVAGEVRTPNMLSVPRGTTISQAVALAGGPTAEGRLNKVRVLRGGRRYDVDLTDPKSTWAGAPIRSGDEIIIARRSNFFRDIFFPFVGVAGAAASIVTAVRR